MNEDSTILEQITHHRMSYSAWCIFHLSSNRVTRKRFIKQRCRNRSGTHCSFAFFVKTESRSMNPTAEFCRFFEPTAGTNRCIDVSSPMRLQRTIFLTGAPRVWGILITRCTTVWNWSTLIGARPSPKVVVQSEAFIATRAPTICQCLQTFNLVIPKLGDQT